MQQAFNTMMNQAAQQTGQFNNSAFSPGSPFPFPAAPASAPTTSSLSQATHAASQPVVTVDVPASKVEATPPTDVGNETETKKEPKKYGVLQLPLWCKFIINWHVFLVWVFNFFSWLRENCGHLFIVLMVQDFKPTLD